MYGLKRLRLRFPHHSLCHNVFIDTSKPAILFVQSEDILILEQINISAYLLSQKGTKETLCTLDIMK
jgi:hypothetical protein